MSQPIVECVANYSEGRDQSVIDYIHDSIVQVQGVKVINVHSDRDHHRTVITFIGRPSAVAEAAFFSIAAAVEHIDMEAHQGQHPRIGAADVIPFVPIRDIMMADCVELARGVGQRVGALLGLPVYLYEQAALRDSRRNLADVRRGQYEGLKQVVGVDSQYAPDYGPALLGKGGAVAVGARGPLIAFNVYLGTSDVQVARRIAENLRFSSGGFRFVKALGLLVDGQAQVSMNVTDYTKNPLPQIIELIRREALRYGVLIQHSELVGVMPLQTLIDTGKWYLQLDSLSAEDILETHLMDLD